MRGWYLSAYGVERKHAVAGLRNLQHTADAVHRGANGRASDRYAIDAPPTEQPRCRAVPRGTVIVPYRDA